MANPLLMAEIFDNINEGIYILNRKGDYIYCNNAFLKMVGATREEALSLNAFQLIPEGQVSVSVAVTAFTEKKKVSVVNNVLTPKGYHYRQLATATPIFGSGGEVEYMLVETVRLDLLAKRYQQAILYEDDSTIEVPALSPERARAKETIIADSPAMQAILQTAAQVAQTDSTVLISGETGTGKELIVNAIQKTSRRKDAPFIKQNCASIPSTLLESILFGTTKGSYTGAKDTPGLFELADGGTLFLDEINSMELTAQAKLLRVLEDNCIRRIGAKEEKQVNVRIIAAVNEDPEGCVERNKIREDIFYRLCVLRYDIPELYRRKGDIPLLMEYFRKHYNKKFHKQIMAYSSEVQDIFLAYNWPGNVRELKNGIESAFHNNHTAILTRNDIPNYILSRLAVDTMHAEDVRGLPLHEMLARYEVLLIEDAYRRNGGSLTKTAAELQVSKQNLAYKMKKYNIR